MVLECKDDNTVTERAYPIEKGRRFPREFQRFLDRHRGHKVVALINWE